MPTRRLSCTLNIPAGYSQTNLDDTVAALLGVNVTGTHLAWQWATLEGAGSGTTSGTFNLAGLTAAIAYFATAKGMKMHLNIKPIDTMGRSVPSDLAGVAFDSATMLSRFHALWDQISPLLTVNTPYVSLGNELDVYMISHPAEWAKYRTFLTDAYAYIHTKNPSVQVGVTLTYHGVISAAKAGCASLQALGDFYGVNYYPEVQGDLTVSSVSASSVLADFAQIVSMAGISKPVVVQECGVQTASISHSSPALQSTFVSSVFAAWAANATHIPWLSWFALYDYDPSTLNGLMSLLGGSTPALSGYLGTLGLLAYNASVAGGAVGSGAKTAWPTFAGLATQLT